MAIKTDLPIKDALPDLKKALAGGTSAVLEAPPGAGKTTVVPLELMNEPWLGGGRIVMLEPRRLAARAAARRMAETLGEEPGGTVGYRTRMDTRVGPSTRIEVVTEGILTRMLQRDPSLEGTALLIFDEFHERSLQADLGLALALDTRAALREDLRILVMSATLDGAEVAGVLGGAPVVRSRGRAYPVEVRHLPETRGATRTDTSTGRGFTGRVASSVRRVVAEEEGSVLVFLPGAGEIRRVEDELRKAALPDDVTLAPLYGNLSRERQDSAIRPAPEGRRKVVLATDIAETSLTIDGVRVVVDGGLARRPRFSPSTGMSTLETFRVTRDSAEQRRGRAGRTAPGVCLRLWTEGEDAGLLERAAPEIREADLAPLALELAVWGVRDPAELAWIDPPPEGAMAQAVELLTRLGALGPDGAATRHGRNMADLPLHPRLAHMVLRSGERGLGNLACHVSALLAEREILKGGAARKDPDLRHRLEVLFGRPGAVSTTEVDRALASRVRKAAGEIKRRAGVGDSSSDAERAGAVLALAYPDRVGKRREAGGGRYLLSGGRGAVLPGGGAASGLLKEDHIVAAVLDGGGAESRVFMAAPLTEADLEEDFSEEITETDLVEWDPREKAVRSARVRRLWRLILSEKPLADPDPDRVLRAFLSGVRASGPDTLPWDGESRNLRARINLLARLGAVEGLGELTEDRLLGNLEGWLGPWVQGMTRLEHLKGLDLSEALLSTLTWQQRRALDDLAPTHITVPSGSRVRLDYASGDRPVLAVRVQEVFGLTETPTVAGGRVKVLVHLLSPARRPLQVTDDLAGFWVGGYEAVKKEMKGRYPKHHWPDDPSRAEPTRGTKKRKR